MALPLPARKKRNESAGNGSERGGNRGWLKWTQVAPPPPTTTTTLRDWMRLQIEILDVRARTTRTHRQAGAGAGRVTGKIGRDDGTKKRGGDGGRAPGESTILAGWKAGGAEDGADAMELQVLYLARRRAGSGRTEEE